MCEFRYQIFLGFNIITSYVLWALLLLHLQPFNGILVGECGTLFDYYGKNLEGLKANRGDVLQKENGDLILIFNEKIIFQMQSTEPWLGQNEVSCHFIGYPDRDNDWLGSLKKMRRPKNLGITLALATKFRDKYLPFDPDHCNNIHYMQYILYGETKRSEQFRECPLAAPLDGVTVDRIKNKSFKLMDSNGKLHDFVEYALPKSYPWADWNEAAKRAAITKRRNSCMRTVRRLFAFLGSADKSKSSEIILKQVKLKASKGRPPLQYRIQLVNKYTVYQAALFMDKNYSLGENLGESLVYELDDDTFDDTDESEWVESLAKGLSVAAFLEDDQGNRGPMIGCNVLDWTMGNPGGTKDDSKKTEKVTNLEANTFRSRSDIFTQTANDLRSKVDVFTLYNCSSYMRGAGLAVAENYRGRGVATELIRAREHVSRIAGLSVDATIFDGAASQRAAEKCGYKAITEMDVRTYKINGKTVYPKPKTPVIKLMAKQYF